MRAHVSPPLLREGFTTGTAATAASLAAITCLITKTQPKTVTTPLPPFDPNPRAWLTVPIEACGSQGKSAWACVIKDGGDDPDCTHGAVIRVEIRSKGACAPIPCSFAKACEAIVLQGGAGVGVVTLPGLPVPVGEPAINPVPRQQIRYAIWHALGNAVFPMALTIQVPHGEELAKHTLNPRLGIVGGISILGTQGIVKAFSHEAFQTTIAEQMQQAKALGINQLLLSTGRRSERILQGLFPDAHPLSSIQVADWIGFALQTAKSLGFPCLVLGLFFGKLVKLAQGHAYTHAKACAIDFQSLAHEAKACGVTTWSSIACAPTARAVSAILTHDPKGQRVFDRLLCAATKYAQALAQCPVSVLLLKEP
ncbi:MAG: cobalamin biosynthesis protein CbiD [Desulfovibrio sp.]|nr:cobalamin biosynthesis protein CbiD [Desulfovibrio sp.]